MTVERRAVRRSVAALTAGRAIKFCDFFLYGLLAVFRCSGCIRRRGPSSR
jgi:hypothetical protein